MRPKPTTRRTLPGPRTAALVRAALLLVLSAGSSGCLGREERVTLEPDGSGVAHVTATFDPAALAALQRRVLARLLAVETPVPVPGVNPIASGWVRAQARHVEGISLLGCDETRTEDGRVVVSSEVRFNSLEAAARAGLFHAAEVAFERRPKKRWRLTLREAWASSGPGADDAFGGVPAAQLRPAFDLDLAALRHDLVLTFPGAVVSTNAELSADRRTVTYRARGDEVAPRGLEVELELPEDQAWPTFRYRPDLAALTRRLVLPAPLVVAPAQPPAEDDPTPSPR